MLCACHGEPMYEWTETWPSGRLHPRTRCAVNERQRQRDLYDNDPIWRLGKNLRNHAQKRAKNLQHRKEQTWPATA